MIQAMRRLLIAVIAAVIAVACTSSTAGVTGGATDTTSTLAPIDHACALVAYWADTTQTVTDPDSGVTSQPEVIDLAKAAWPGDTATEGKFLQLYDDLSSDLTDAQYGREATTFEKVHCPER
jgi:hypothetical protein